ncbi:uncharacterized protein [Patagioenas fasciata]|uniref:uncharacterized protein n=1 Tax=Patagioenas fasciata TaxID=372321 RepID=UPI003A98EAF5
MKRKPLGGEAAQSIAGGHAEIKTDKEKKKERNCLLFWTINKQFVPLQFTLQRQTCRGARLPPSPAGAPAGCGASAGPAAAFPPGSRAAPRFPATFSRNLRSHFQRTPGRRSFNCFLPFSPGTSARRLRQHPALRFSAREGKTPRTLGRDPAQRRASRAPPAPAAAQHPRRATCAQSGLRRSQEPRSPPSASNCEAGLMWVRRGAQRCAQTRGVAAPAHGPSQAFIGLLDSLEMPVDTCKVHLKLFGNLKHRDATYLEPLMHKKGKS